jgi:glycosyltransferase involved in cell wall biosynthesis
MDRANYALASRLATTGHEVHVVAHRVAVNLRRSGVLPHLAARPLGSHALGMPFLARSGKREARALAARGATVVTNGGNCQWPGVNWVHYVHAAYDPAADAATGTGTIAAAQRRFVLDREKRALASARTIICNSARTRADCIERFGVEPSRVHTVHYGTDPIRFSAVTLDERSSARSSLQLHPEAPVVLFVGALGDRRKGFDALFDAWRSLCADPGWQATLLVAGEGRELPRWVQRVKGTPVEPRIRFLGFRRDVPALLAASDVVVHPARYEAYGLSVHEAICRGVPAIVSARAGVAERVPPDYAPLLLEQVTAGHVETALRHWQREADRWRAITTTVAGAWRARTWDDMADDIIELARRD